jgi:predicted nucleic acid-binding protein
MRRLFADTFYWMAMLYTRDQWHRRVVQYTGSLGPHQLITTDAVLIEYLAAFSGMSAHLRQQAGATARQLLERPHVTVIPHDRALFLEGLSLYEARPDKGYSLTDCISMQVMRREGLTESLTNDHHFTQEGFEILFR